MKVEYLNIKCPKACVVADYLACSMAAQPTPLKLKAMPLAVAGPAAGERGML